jgi:hypothetical protein
MVQHTVCLGVQSLVHSFADVSLLSLHLSLPPRHSCCWVTPAAAAAVLQVAPACNIFARASPENKLRIVRALQRAAPKRAAAAVAKAAAAGQNLAAVSRNLVTKASTSRGISTTSRNASPDVIVDINLGTDSYGSDLTTASEKKLRWVWVRVLDRGL